MGGLNAALSIASGALEAQSEALDTADNNISNVDTPGYSREIVNLSSAADVDASGVAVGNGVTVDGITSVRDQLLDLRVQQQTSDQAAAAAQNTVLSSVETYFSGTGLTSALSTFFTSVSALSSAPSNTAARQTVIADAEDLVGQFHATSEGLTSTQSGLNTEVAGDVAQINSLAAQVATLNGQIAQQAASGQTGGVDVDQRTELEQQLAALTSVSVTTTAQGDTLTTGNGTALVVGTQSFALSTSSGADGLTQVLDGAGNDITGSLTGGDLGGLITARDTTIPGFETQLDTLANGFATAFNAAQSTGYDLDGSSGGALFTLPSSIAGSAGAIALRTTNGSAIAASSDGSAGSNGNVAALAAVQSQPLASGLSATDSLSALVGSVGNAASTANTQSTALQASLSQLTSQQTSVSGVSVDEESTNLIRFQQAYQAAAEVVSTIQTLFTSTLDMVSTTGA